MLIRPKLLTRYWDLCPETIVHVGGHEAEELREYQEEGWGSAGVIWVEALPAQAQYIRGLVASQPHHTVLEAVVWDRAGVEIDFHEASNTQASSVLEFGSHQHSYPEIHRVRTIPMVTNTLENLLQSHISGGIGLLNLDVQGSELQVLQGLGPRISDVETIYTEVNVEEVYKGCVLLEDLDSWLSEQGFVQVDIRLTQDGWGDGLWLRRDRVPSNPALRRNGRRVHTALGKIRRALT